MDNTKYTKGKWLISNCPFYDEGEYHGTFDIITNGRKSIITGVPAYSFYNQTFETAKANAILISKAPEMLEMLTDAVNEYKAGEKVSNGWYKAVEQLIKEATEI